MLQINIKAKNSLFGKYPSCDLLNNAIRYLRDGETDEALIEIIYAIEKANGYFYEDLEETVREAKSRYWKDKLD